MSGLDLKTYINDNHIYKILKHLECNDIKEHPKYFSCSNPDGDNQNAIIVYKNTLNVENYTRPEFNDYYIKDIISLVEFILDINYYKAIKIICEICGFDYYNLGNSNSSLLTIIKNIETNNFETEEKFIELNENILDIYEKTPTKKWIDSQINYEAHEKFNIRFDLFSERIIIPIYDEIGNLIGIKGRSLNDNEDNKYVYLYECPKSKILYGLYQNYHNIKAQNHVIIVEGEKSVIKLYGFGYRNVIAIGGKYPSKHQIEKILRLGVKNITLALDKDVSNKEIKNICKKFDIGLEFLNIEYLYDTYNFMNKKDSPSDDINIFKLLLDKFRYKYVSI
jgi:DNA primase